MKHKVVIIVCCWLSLGVHAQPGNSVYVGTYGDWMPNGEVLTTELELKPDGTFQLRALDNIYPQTFSIYSNRGVWIVKEGAVFLNPMLKKRQPRVTMAEKTIGFKDSIEIKINHYIEVFENQKFLEQKKTEFELLTLYFNKKRNYRHLTREGYDTGSCAWAPRIRNRVNLDSSNTFRVAKMDIEKLGIYTYGFTGIIEISPENNESDYFEIDVVVPMDKERMPRDKKVLIRGKRAYFHEIQGEVKKTLTPLLKKPE